MKRQTVINLELNGAKAIGELAKQTSLQGYQGICDPLAVVFPVICLPSTQTACKSS